MKESISPAEYQYLKDPFFSLGDDMLKYTLQDLCLRKIVKVERKWILLNKRDKRKRLRFFFSQGVEFSNYKTINSAEEFILKPFQKNEVLRFYMLRNYIVKEFEEELQRFKKEYVYPDLKRKGLCRMRFFPTLRGRKLRNEVSKKIKNLDLSVKWIEADSPKLSEELQNLGSNILFLSDQVHEKIKIISNDIWKIKDIEFLGMGAYRISNLGYGLTAGSFSIGGFSGGGFSGFSGGSFGGGGAGGSW